MDKLSEECCCGKDTSLPTTLADKLSGSYKDDQPPNQLLNPNEAKNSDCVLWESTQCPTKRTLKIILKRVKPQGLVSCESGLQPATDRDRPEVAIEDCNEVVVVDAATTKTPVHIHVTCPTWRLHFPKLRPFKDPNSTLGLRKSSRSAHRRPKSQEHAATEASEQAFSRYSTTSRGQRKASHKKHLKLDMAESEVGKCVRTDHTYSV